MTWLPVTLLAALFQAWRTAVQQRVRADLSVNAAGLVRYLYGLPVGILLLLVYLGWSGNALPAFGTAFIAYAVATALAQILGTNALLMAFGARNYVVGTAYAKTEAIQGAILSMILLGEMLSGVTWAGIAVGVAGVVLLSTGGQRLKLSDMVQPAALYGLAAGLGFTLTSIFVKSATFDVATDNKLLAALLALVAVQAAQTLMQGSYVLLREPNQVRPVFATWRISSQVGVLAALGSACWFWAFATAPVALVRAVGQIEVVFTLAFSRFYLKEPLRIHELGGLILVGVGVAVSLLGA